MERKLSVTEDECSGALESTDDTRSDVSIEVRRHSLVRRQSLVQQISKSDPTELTSNIKYQNLLLECKEVNSLIEKKEIDLDDLNSKRLQKSYPYSLLIVGSRGTGKTMLFVNLQIQITLLAHQLRLEASKISSTESDITIGIKSCDESVSQYTLSEWNRSPANLYTVPLCLGGISGSSQRPRVADVFLWDAREQSASSFYYGTKCVIIVFDISDYSTFDLAKNTYDDAVTRCRPGVSFAMVANKVDLPNRQVSSDQISSYCSSRRISVFECSARDDPSSLNPLAIFIQNEIINCTDDVIAEEDPTEINQRVIDLTNHIQNTTISVNVNR